MFETYAKQFEGFDRSKASWPIRAWLWIVEYGLRVIVGVLLGPAIVLVCLLPTRKATGMLFGMLRVMSDRYFAQKGEE